VTSPFDFVSGLKKTAHRNARIHAGLCFFIASLLAQYFFPIGNFMLGFALVAAGWILVVTLGELNRFNLLTKGLKVLGIGLVIELVALIVSGPLFSLWATIPMIRPLLLGALGLACLYSFVICRKKIKVVNASEGSVWSRSIF